jgi:uncharacterized membrane protein
VKRRLVALSVLGLTACDIEQLADAECPEQGTTLTYENFAASFFARWCNDCHHPYSLDRHGAPGEFNFDTAWGIRRHADRIFARSASGNDSMPPGPDDPPRSERELLAEWLSCGAPEEERGE